MSVLQIQKAAGLVKGNRRHFIIYGSTNSSSDT